jgi:hypothetical protein
MAATSATLAKGYGSKVNRDVGGTCTTTSDQYKSVGGTCTAMGSINSYQMTANTNVETFNAFGDMCEKVVALLSSYEFTASGGFDYADAAQKAYWDNIVGTGAHAELALSISETKARYCVKGIVTQAQVGSSAQGLGTFSFTMKVNYIPYTCSK